MSFKLYLEKLNPKLEALFQRSKANTPSNGPWFDGQVLGIKSLEKIMKEISTDAGLSISYTNHSIRATCITLLDDAGNEARHIMSVSGHKNESSIRSYSKTNLKRKRNMSTLLSSTMNLNNFSFNINFDNNKTTLGKLSLNNATSSHQHVENHRFYE